MVTVVEASLFQKLWPTYWTEDERGEFAALIAAAPDAGVVVKESGGIRKLRWKRQGTGKSGGVRVIHFIKNEAEEMDFVVALCQVGNRQHQRSCSQGDSSCHRRLVHSPAATSLQLKPNAIWRPNFYSPFAT